MIKTSRQLKDLIRNRAKGDSDKSGLLIRNYGMERFLERVTLSKYKDNFILKGGMLVSSTRKSILKKYSENHRAVKQAIKHQF